MRGTSRLLAKAASTGSGLRAPPVNIMPAIPLYRRILKSHRKLPPDLRFIGDKYVKAEFRKHKDVEHPSHIIGFLTEWQLYAQSVEGDAWKGERLDPTRVEKLSDEQKYQLYQLLQAIRNPEAGEDGEGGSKE